MSRSSLPFAPVTAMPDLADAALRVQTLGGFRLWRAAVEVEPAEWGRDKAVQLFQFLVSRRRRRLTREQIVEALWPDSDPEAAERDFKVALNGVQRVLEPERAARAEPRFLRRFGPAYGLDADAIWIDAALLEAELAAGHAALPGDPETAAVHLRRATALYRGEFLPERRYEDWASAEAERLETLALGAMTTLAGLVVETNPLEALDLSQRVLAIDPIWEEAWRIQMRAHLAAGNRALALRAWERCVELMRREIGLDPLPATRAVHAAILAAGGQAENQENAR